MSPVGVAIIGGGLFVKSQHMPAVAKCDQLSLKAIYSRSLSSAKDTASLAPSADNVDLYAGDAGVGKTYHDLLLRDDIQAVIIALPILVQPEFVEAALTAGKHVLAEKPIAKDLDSAKGLIAFHEKAMADTGATLAVAENVRFSPSLRFAREHISRFGRVTHVAARVMNLTSEDNRYFQTAWRKTPGYQGGFLLDGGVHHAAATRLLLGRDDAVQTVRAFTAQAQEHLPPIDTVNAILKLRSGGTGTFQVSAGTLSSAYEWDIACEGGNVKMIGDKVTVKPRGVAESEHIVKDFPRTSGVAEEVAAWARAVAENKPNPFQSAQEALADLEFMEKLFKSGDSSGESETLGLQ